MIPQNLDECFQALDSLLCKEDKDYILDHDIDCMIDFHSNLGRHIRNEWKLWHEEETPLKDYFKTLGITHPDDMSGIILKSYWLIKHNKPLEIEKQAQEYIDHWKNLKGKI